MAFNFLKKLRQSWFKTWTPNGSKARTYIRPRVEALEDRVVPATRTWTGGSVFSNLWSDSLNWQNAAPPQPGDSVVFPADAKRRTNVEDIDLKLGHDATSGTIILRALNNVHIEGGDYDIDGAEIDLTGTFSSDAGNNTIHNTLAFLVDSVDTIDVGSDSLTLTGELAGTRCGESCVVGSPQLIKTGAGTLKVSNIVGISVPANPCPDPGDPFEVFTVQQGLVSMQAGGQLRVDLHIENGGIVRLQQGGDQITGPGRLPNVTIDAGGVMDLNGHSEGLGNLTLNGAITTGAAGTLVIEGDVTTDSTAAAVIAGRVDLGGTASTSRTFNVADGTATNDLFIDGVIQGAAKLIKDGPGQLTLTGTASNTYTGLTQVKAGVLNLAKPDFLSAIVGTLLIGSSFGASNNARVRLAADDQILNTAAVQVNASGLLDLQGHNEILSGLILAGKVTTGAGLLSLLGDVTTESGARIPPTISGNVSLRSTRVFNVVDALAGTDLIVDAIIVDGALTKTGAGTMLMSGTSPNTYTGTTRVNEGTLILGKLGLICVNGSLIIGDGVGGADADKVVLQFSDQIVDSAAVTVNSSGLVDLNNLNEKIGDLTLVGGHVNSGNAGRFTPTGTITAATAPTMAIISGRLDNSQRNISVASSVSGTDLLIDAVIVNGGITKTGPGRLELTANNTYTLSTTINEGQLAVNGSINSLVQLNGGTLLGSGALNGVDTFADGGRVQPGDGFGTLTSNGDFRLQSDARFEPQILPLAPDPHDVLKVQGTVTLGGATLAVQSSFLSSIPPPNPILLDNSGPNFTITTGFQQFTGAGNGLLNNNMHFANPGDGSAKATWTFQGLQPGSYRVSHVSGNNNLGRATNAPFTIFNGTTLVTTVLVNQNIVTKDFNKFGVNWDILGTVQVTGNSLTVQLTNNNANAIVFADAILLEPRQVVIIDNDGADSVVGTFANLPEGATINAVATGVIGGVPVQQTQQYTISYRTNDGNDVGLAYITTATAAQDLLITPSTIHVGQKVTLTGHLTDPDVGDFLTLTIDWGDGKSETHHPGTQSFAFDHRYASNPPGPPRGAYKVHLTWFDQHNAGNSRDLAVTVQNGARALLDSTPAVLLSAEVLLQAVGTLSVPGLSNANYEQAASNLVSAVLDATGTTFTIEGTLNSKPLSTFSILFYSSPTGDPQGKKFLGLVPFITNAAGFVKFRSQLTVEVPLGDVITATAIDSLGNTSKFSASRAVS